MPSEGVLILTVSLTLIGLSVLILSHAWKSLKEVLGTLPEGEQRVRFSLKEIKRDVEREKASFILVHFSGCVFFGLCIALSAFTLLAITMPALGIQIGQYAEANYNAGKYIFLIEVFFFVMGLWFISFTYIGSVVSVITGKKNILTGDASKIEDRPAKEQVRNTIISSYLFTIAFSTALFNTVGFNAWVSVISGIVVSFVCVTFVYGLRDVIRNFTKRNRIP